MYEQLTNAFTAVIIGCGPGLYRKAKAVYKTHQASYNSKGYNSKGYARQRNGTGGAANGSDLHAHDLDTFGSKQQRTTTTIRGGSKNWSSSQEELRGTPNDYEIVSLSHSSWTEASA